MLSHQRQVTVEGGELCIDLTAQHERLLVVKRALLLLLLAVVVLRHVLSPQHLSLDVLFNGLLALFVLQPLPLPFALPLALPFHAVLLLGNDFADVAKG